MPSYRDTTRPNAYGGAYKPPKLRKLRPFGQKQTGTDYGHAAPGALGNKSLTSLKPTPRPAAKPAGVVDPLPVDPQYIQDTTGLNRGYADAQAAYTYGNTGLDERYGFKSSMDAAGNVTGITVDPSNPYSLANALQKSYDNSKRGATNSYAAAGQLYAGSAQHAQNLAGDAYQEGYNALTSDYAGGKHDLYSTLAGARDTYTTGKGQAYLDSVGRALKSPYASLPVAKGGKPAASGSGAPAKTGPAKAGTPPVRGANRRAESRDTSRAEGTRAANERRQREYQQQPKRPPRRHRKGK